MKSKNLSEMYSAWDLVFNCWKANIAIVCLHANRRKLRSQMFEKVLLLKYQCCKHHIWITYTTQYIHFVWRVILYYSLEINLPTTDHRNIGIFWPKDFLFFLILQLLKYLLQYPGEPLTEGLMIHSWARLTFSKLCLVLVFLEDGSCLRFMW